MRFLLHVGHPVVVEVGGGGEGLAAHFTHVRLLPRVDAAVGVQAGAGGESLVTEVTNIGPLARVGSANKMRNEISLEKI